MLDAEDARKRLAPLLIRQQFVFETGHHVAVSLSPLTVLTDNGHAIVPEKENHMPATMLLPLGPELEDKFDLNVVIVFNDEECAVSESCDTSDGCSSTCPSACTSGA